MEKPSVWGKLYLALILFLLYLPILVVAAYSFNAASSGAQWTGFTLSWYKKLLEEGKYTQPLLHSIELGLISAFLAGVIGTAAALSAATRAFKTKGVFESLSMLPIMIPEIILGISFMSMFALVGLRGGMLPLVLAHTTFCIPYVYIIVKGRIRDLDPSVIEAARTLGATKIRAFLTVTLPIILPAVLSGCLLSFAMSFDDVIISSYLRGPTSELLPTKIYAALKLGVTPDVNALFTLILGVMLLLVATMTVTLQIRKILQRKVDAQ